MALPRKSRRPLALLAPALLLAVTGCSGDDDEAGGGTGTVEDNVATASGVSFEVPDGWETIDPAELADGATEDLEEAADAVGLTPEELQSTMAGADLIVLDDEVTDDFRNNINVTSPGGTLPSAEEAAAQLETAGATISDSGTVETDAGEAITVDYELPVGAASVQGTAIGVDNDGELVLITVSTLDADTTDEIATAITDSLAAE